MENKKVCPHIIGNHNVFPVFLKMVCFFIGTLLKKNICRKYWVHGWTNFIRWSFKLTLLLHSNFLLTDSSKMKLSKKETNFIVNKFETRTKPLKATDKEFVFSFVWTFLLIWSSSKNRKYKNYIYLSSVLFSAFQFFQFLSSCLVLCSFLKFLEVFPLKLS